MDKVLEIQRKGGVARVKLLSGDTLRIPSALFLERRLRVGQGVDAEGYRQFMRQRGYPHALEAAMKFLALRERSQQEVRARLRRSCYDEGVIVQVLDALAAHELVSDPRFAEAWVGHRARKYGKNRIAQELKMKGVEGEDVRKALDTLPEEEEFAHAQDQARKLSKRLQGDEMKITQALVRRGYSWSMAKKATEAAKKTSR